MNKRIETIKERSSFVKLNGESKFIVSGFILQMGANPKLAENAARIGFTVTKKMGGAVVRNRIKRRLREASRKVMQIYAKPGYDYVLIARHKALACDFSELVREMEFAFSRIKDK